METTGTTLVDVLERQCRCHEQLVQAARAMNDALKRGDVAAVRGATALYDTIMQESGELEEKRLELCDRVAAHLVPPRTHVTIAAIMESCSAGMATQLGGMRERLRTLIHELQSVVASNEVMLQEGLHAIDKRFELMATGHKKFTGYQSRGTMETPTVNLSILNRVV